MMSAKIICTIKGCGFIAKPYSSMSSQEIYKLHLSADHDLCPYCFHVEATEDHVISEHINQIPLFKNRLQNWVDAHSR
jgi:hypothetical protein